MTPEDEEFLTKLYRNLNKQPVPPTAPEYVALEELPGQVMGPDAVKLLGRTVTMTTPGESFFLTGLRGSGKTVQLLRLKRDLRNRGLAVIMFSAEDYLSMHEPLNVVDGRAPGRGGRSVGPARRAERGPFRSPRQRVTASGRRSSTLVQSRPRRSVPAGRNTRRSLSG